MHRTTVSPPDISMLAMEPMRAFLEFAQAHYLRLEAYPDGDGHAVVLFPGLGADHAYMSPLERHCRRLGYACYHWGRGRNMGHAGSATTWLSELAGDIEEMLSEHPETVTFIGWSLGGLYAREVAKAIPARVRQVITLGTPSANLADASNVTWLYELLSGSSVAVSASLATALQILPPVPTTSIYSRSDGVVAWESCRIMVGPQAENMEVNSSHLGLVWHPDVLRIVANRLAQSEETWTSYMAGTSAHNDRARCGAAHVQA